MAYLITLLSALACPLLMGLMMWFMTRATRTHDTNLAQTSTRTRVQRRPLLGRWCLNWKVIAGLTWGIFAVWLAFPSLVWAALPFVIMAACPLSMLLMMRGMGGHQGATQSEKEQPTGVSVLGDVRRDELPAPHDAATREHAEVEQRAA